jgi:AraC-like DNA-binding protein
LALPRLASVLEELAARLRLPHLAIEIVKAMPLGAFGTPDYQFSASATLADAWAHGLALLSSFTNMIEIEIQPSADTIRVVRRHRHRLSPTVQELARCFAVRRFRDVLGDDGFPLLCVHFPHPARGPAVPYEAFFAAPVHFQSDWDGFEFRRDLLNAPLLTATPSLSRMLAASVPAPHRDEFLLRVRGAVDRALAGPNIAIALEDVARALAMSPRSLQRRLADHGISYSTLLDEARRDLAKSLLAREGVLLADVAYRLGFSQVTAFFRAFRRWTGMRPREFQRLLKS